MPPNVQQAARFLEYTKSYAGMRPYLHNLSEETYFALTRQGNPVICWLPWRRRCKFTCVSYRVMSILLCSHLFNEGPREAAITPTDITNSHDNINFQHSNKDRFAITDIKSYYWALKQVLLMKGGGHFFWVRRSPVIGRKWTISHCKWKTVKVIHVKWPRKATWSTKHGKITMRGGSWTGVLSAEMHFKSLQLSTTASLASDFALEGTIPSLPRSASTWLSLSCSLWFFSFHNLKDTKLDFFSSIWFPVPPYKQSSTCRWKA